MLTGLIQDHNFQQLVRNLSLVEDEDRFYNWYHGRSQLWIPYWGQAGDTVFNIRDLMTQYSPMQAGEFDTDCTSSACTKVALRYSISTNATSGTISTRHYGQRFDAGSVVRDVIYYVEFTPPEELLTLHVEIDKNLIEGIDDAFGMCSDAKTSCTKQFKHVEPMKWFEIDRTMSAAEVNELVMDLMPGFRITWFYGEDRGHHENLYDYDDEDGESSDFKRF